MREVFNPLNNKAVTFLDILASTVIIIIVILMLSRFQLFLATSNQNLSKKLVFFETVNNKITDIYMVGDWGGLKEETIETDLGDIVVKYFDYEPETHNLTSRIIVEFAFEEKTREYVLERSIYFGE